MTPERLAHETDSAVEKLLLKKNGERKTVQDVFEIVVAMNHDRRSDAVLLLNEIKNSRELTERHLREDVRMTNEEFSKFINGFNLKHEHRDEVVTSLEKELESIKENCLEIHKRAPRRKDDPDTEDWGTGMYEQDVELGDLRRAWRVLKWVVVVVGGTLLVAAGDHLSHLIWGG